MKITYEGAVAMHMVIYKLTFVHSAVSPSHLSLPFEGAINKVANVLSSRFKSESSKALPNAPNAVHVVFMK